MNSQQQCCVCSNGSCTLCHAVVDQTADVLVCEMIDRSCTWCVTVVDQAIVSVPVMTDLAPVHATVVDLTVIHVVEMLIDLTA